MTSGLIVRDEFERCWPFLEPAVDLRTHSKEDIWELIERRQAHFCPMPDAAVVGGISMFPNGFKDVNVRWAGGNLYTILQWVPSMEAWAKNRGCHRAVIYGREQWQRALDGYEKIGVRLAKDLIDGR